MLGCCKLLGVRIFCSCSCPVSESRCFCKPPTRHTLFFVLQLFISIWMEKCYTLEGQSLENGLSCTFHATGNILFFLRRHFLFLKIFIYLFIYLFIYFLAVLGLRFCVRFSLAAASGDHSSSRCVGLSLSRSLLLRSTGSRRAGSVVVAHGPSCSTACGIFPDQGSNPCLLH